MVDITRIQVPPRPPKNKADRLVCFIFLHALQRIGTIKYNAANQIIQRVNTYHWEQVRLIALAEELGYSPSYLSQRFIRVIDISFMEYLHQVRVDRSCHLLQTTDMRFSRIAAEVGYEDLKYFNKIFKQHLAVMPREFRSA